MRLELIATTTFGLEAVAKREIIALGYDIIKVEDGKVTYKGDESAIAKSNLWLRTVDRVLLKIDEFKAYEFEELFQRVKGYPWEQIIPINGKITVNGTSVKSKLHSVPACQSIVNKAIASHLCEVYNVSRLPETGEEYKIKVSFLKDRATITIDTSGPGLHKRGYRIKDVEAPMKETLAAGLVLLTFYRDGRSLVDPCCGSGTIPIEAAMIGKNIAPGLNRKFISEDWPFIDKEIWKEERKSAYASMKHDAVIDIKGYDIDKKAIEASKENAIEAGVDDVITFEVGDIEDFKPEVDNGLIITNPPYGERIGDEAAISKIYRALREFRKENIYWSVFVITSDKENFELAQQQMADRRRKLYNGRLEICYFQYRGEKKPKDE